METQSNATVFFFTHDQLQLLEHMIYEYIFFLNQHKCTSTCIIRFFFCASDEIRYEIEATTTEERSDNAQIKQREEKEEKGKEEDDEEKS